MSTRDEAETLFGAQQDALRLIHAYASSVGESEFMSMALELCDGRVPEAPPCDAALLNGALEILAGCCTIAADAMAVATNARGLNLVVAIEEFAALREAGAIVTREANRV